MKKQTTKTKIENFPVKPSIKWVKKAGMWCKTEFTNGKQVQNWFSSLEEAKK